jgi:hypothetical protein
MTCPWCQQPFPVEGGMVGRSVCCPNCTQAVALPADLAPAGAEPVGAARPRRKRRPRTTPQRLPLPQTLLLVALVGLVMGGILAWLGGQQLSIYKQGSATPQDIRLADLAEHGPGNNIHVRVTDFTFGKHLVVEEKRGRWNRVWIPMLPAGADPGDRTAKVKVLAKSFNVPDETELARFTSRHVLTGVLTNSIWPLDSSEESHLKKEYPESDFSSVLIVQEGYSFPTPAKIALFLGGGGALLLIALASGITGLVTWRKSA